MYVKEKLSTRVRVFIEDEPNKSTKLIGGQCSGLLNWDDIAYPQFYQIYKVLRDNFWKPEEVNLKEDRNQWLALSDAERMAFKKTIGLLSVLDSIQTVSITDIGKYFSDSSVRAILSNIAFMESVHNQSYAYILSSIAPQHEQKEILDMPKTDETLIARNKIVFDLYEQFNENQTKENLLKFLVGSTILEGINFIVGFAFFYALARRGKMLGTSTIIEFIQRDELQHCYFGSQLYRIILAENPELNTEENAKWVYETIDKAVHHEIEWARKTLSDVEHIDLYELEQYIQYTANKRLRQLGLDNLYEVGEKNPMPWITAYENVNNSKKDFFEQKLNAYSKLDDEVDDL